MTPSQFCTWAEAVFGKYTPAMKAEVEAWLEPHTQYFIAALREVTLREHPSIYGKPPGVHEVEAWKIEAYQRGHTLEAIAAAKSGQTLLAADGEAVMPPEEAIAKLREIIAGLAGKGARDA